MEPITTQEMALLSDEEILNWIESIRQLPLLSDAEFLAQNDQGILVSDNLMLRRAMDDPSLRLWDPANMRVFAPAILPSGRQAQYDNMAIQLRNAEIAQSNPVEPTSERRSRRFWNGVNLAQTAAILFAVATN